MGTVTVFSVLAGLANLAGGTFSLLLARSRSHMQHLAALSAGFLLGGALLVMLPAAVQGSGSGHQWVAAGFVGLLLIQRVSAEVRGQPRALSSNSPESAWATFFGLGIHTFFEGAMLGVVVHTGHQLTWFVLLASILHKLPEGFTLSGLVLSATGSRRLAIWAAAAVGLAMVAGTWAAVLWSGVATIPQGDLMGVAAGAFLYVAGTEMLPTILRRGRLPVGLLLLGMLLAHASSVL